MSVTNRAGHAARTGRDDSHAQNSSGTTCDGCDHRDAEGVNVDGRSLCRPCARRAETLVADGGTGEDEELIPYPARSYEGRDARDLQPARVAIEDTAFNVDHVEEREQTFHLVNYDDHGNVEECVSFPYHVVEHVEWHPAEKARELSPYDGRDPLAARTETEADADD